MKMHVFRQRDFFKLKIHFKKPTPVFLPGESQAAVYGVAESDKTEVT